MLRFALFDIDDTLYPPSSGLWDAIGERINLYMIQRLGLGPAEAAALRDHYFHSFGTTLNGLRLDYHINPEDYLAFVHDLPLADFIRPDPALDGMLARLPLTTVAFTNADAPHAQRVLDRLGVTRRFARIIDIHALGFINKPDPRAYARALDLLSAHPEECVFADDTLRNLLPAHASGMLTVWVTPKETTDGDRERVDYVIPDILALERVVAGLIGRRG